MLMKGQLSLEFMIIKAVFITILSMTLPHATRIVSASEYAVTSANARFVLNQVYSACERSRISEIVIYFK